jgi:hypothetical protein
MISSVGHSIITALVVGARVDKTLHTSVTLTSTGFSGLTINSTAFVGIELLHVTKIVTSMGMAFIPFVLNNLTFSRCNL